MVIRITVERYFFTQASETHHITIALFIGSPDLGCSVLISQRLSTAVLILWAFFMNRRQALLLNMLFKSFSLSFFMYLQIKCRNTLLRHVVNNSK